MILLLQLMGALLVAGGIAGGLGYVLDATMSNPLGAPSWVAAGLLLFAGLFWGTIPLALAEILKTLKSRS